MKRLLLRLWTGPGLLWTFALLLVTAALWPKPPYNPRVLEKLACVADAVALKQHLFVRWESGRPVPADIIATFQDRFNRLQRYTTSLRRSDDRHIHAFRPIMIEAEAARDAAVAKDADAYLSAAWAKVQACDDALFKQATA
jgi:hypothetical protein